MSLVKKNSIYLFGEKRNKIVWVGDSYFHNNFLDKQYTGHYYTEDLVKNFFKEEITIEEALQRNLISYDRFQHMDDCDKETTLKLMLKLKGIAKTLNFLSQDSLHLSEKELMAILNSREA